MNIRPKIPMFQKGGLPSTVTWADPNSTWFTRSGDFGILEGTYNYLKPLYDKWKSSGKLEDYLAYKKAVDTLNTNLRYGYAPKHLLYLSNNNLLYRDNDVGAWQKYVRDNYGFINNSIGNNFTKYKIHSNNPYSGDNSGKEWKVDNLWAGITDDRTTWGNLLNSNDPIYQKWKLKFSEIGIDYRTNPEWNTGDVLYGFLREENLNPPSLNNPPSLTVQQENPNKKITRVNTNHEENGYGFNWDKIKEVGLKIFGNPNLYAFGRLAGNLINNERVYDEQLKGIKPVLRQTYNTHRQIVGDEATKQAYYRRAASGQTRASLPFTSDADRQMAYMQEARRIGDELRAQGDLADNQEIRRTSDESNQHQWANTLRATEVANANIASINQANALKHNLLAQKHSAQWSSIDNFLQGVEYRKRQQLAEQLALNDQIYSLTRAGEIENDSILLDLQSQLEAASKNPLNQKTSFGLTIIDYNAPQIKSIINKIKNRQRELQIETYQNRYNNKYNLFLLAKSGTKITYKKKDDLLYKSAKDVVEHFRKMSKLSSDAQNRKNPKIEKLAQHPKGTRRYLLGGIAPFTVYKPVALGGETSISSLRDVSGSKSSKETEGKETLDLVKSLFKEILGKGLPIDVNYIYSSMNDLFSRQKAFGNELSTNDIALLYLLSMLQVNNAMHSKEVYDKAKAYATQNDSLDEYAVNALGHFLVQDLDTGKISTEKSWKDVLTSGKNPITNLLLLYLREYDPNLVSQKGDYLIENVINNGMGINKIGALIKALAGNIGSYDGKIEGLTQVESNKVKQGLLLLTNAPNGYYKHTVEDKNLQTQMKAAISYITNMLSPSLRAILDSHGGSDQLIPLFLSSQENVTHNVSFLPLTGKASDKNSNGSGGKGDSDNSAGLAFVLGQGPRVPVVFNTGTSYLITANGIQGVLLNKSNENLGLGATLLDASKSLEGGYFLWNKATFGGSKLIPTAFNHIILNDSTVIGVDLPYKKGIDGNEIPDFLQLKRMEEADQEIRQKGILSNDYNAINLIYLNHLLSPKYDLNGKLNKQDYKRFAIILATLDETSLLNKNAILSDEVAIANEVERDLYNESMRKITGNNKFELDEGWPIFGGGTKLYKGSIFVPYLEDIAFAALSSGKPLNVDLPNNSSTVQLMQYAPATLNYKPLDITLSQIKNN